MKRGWNLFILAGISTLLAFAHTAQAETGDLFQRFTSESQRLVEDARERGTMTVTGKDGWFFFDQELAHIAAGKFWGADAAKVSRSPNPEFADPLPAILDFQARLKDVGVDLLLVPVPPKALIYPDFLGLDMIFEKELPRLDPLHREFYSLLEKQGVRVLDLTEVFLKERFHEHGPLYCRQDTHWSGVGCVLAAQRIAGKVKKMSWYDELQPQTFASQWRDVQISGDLWRALNDQGLERETLPLRQVGLQGQFGLNFVEPEQNSPIILLGDSHNLVFQAGGDMHAQGAGLADQLALELGLPVDLIAVRGSGATPARINLFRRAQRSPEYWQGKKLVIWVFTAREFTHADGWRNVPIAP